MFATELVCRQCGKTVPLGPAYYCDDCFGPLEVTYDYAAIREQVPRSEVASGPPNIWRYAALLPIGGGNGGLKPYATVRGGHDPATAGGATEGTRTAPVDLGTGWTPLLKADNLGRALGLRDLWIKNDSVNPTFSFKDRNVAVATNAALEFGFDTLACASTGNLAGSVAGFAARAGLKSYVFVPADLEPNKLLTATVCGARLVTIDANYDQVNRLCTQIADQLGWGFANINLRPFYSEGSKTLGLEIAEQFGWEAPDAIVIPMGGASLLTKVGKALRELLEIGWLDRADTRLIGAQAEGCAPVVRAFRAGSDEVAPVIPDTIAKSLAIGDPADGYYALQAIRETGGYAEAAEDEEIVEGIRLLARCEGIFTETAGGTVVAVARRLREQGVLNPDERTVLAITGNGLKTPEVIADGTKMAIHLERASLGAFEAALEGIEGVLV
jgi:threonine synthase